MDNDTVQNIVNGIWDVLRRRKLDPKRVLNDPDEAILRDIYAAMCRAATGAVTGRTFSHPFEDEDEHQ